MTARKNIENFQEKNIIYSNFINIWKKYYVQNESHFCTVLVGMTTSKAVLAMAYMGLKCRSLILV